VKLDISLTQRISRQLSVFASSHNLTNNAAIEYANSVPATGRVTMLGVEVQP
jgi:hypothetical protein